jgi:hypothetical protein
MTACCDVSNRLYQVLKYQCCSKDGSRPPKHVGEGLYCYVYFIYATCWFYDKIYTAQNIQHQNISL